MHALILYPAVHGLIRYPAEQALHAVTSPGIERPAEHAVAHLQHWHHHDNSAGHCGCQIRTCAVHALHAVVKKSWLEEAATVRCAPSLHDR